MITAIFTAASAIIQGLSPLLQGATTFFVWYVTEIFKGFGVIIQNLSTLVVIGTIIFGTGVYIKHKDSVDCVKQVVIQKHVDAKKAAKK